MAVTPEIVAIVGPFISGAMGVGFAYGVLRANLENLKKDVARNQIKLESQVGETRCFQMREDCQKTICKQIMEIKQEVKSNRDYVISKYEEIARFMGKMNGKET